MFSYTIEVIERDSNIAVRAKPSNVDITDKEREVGVTIAVIISSALAHIARRHENGLVVESDTVDTYVGKEIDKLFDGK